MKTFFKLIAAVLFLFALFFLYEMRGVSKDSAEYLVDIKSGDGFRKIAGVLKERNFIRSESIFKIYSIFSGSAHRFGAGEYMLSPSWSVFKIVNQLVSGPEDIRVAVLEGETVLDINNKLHSSGVLPQNVEISQKLEGYLFPDTYFFLRNSTLDQVIGKFSRNFDQKVLPVFIKSEFAKNSNGVASIQELSDVEEEILRQIIILASLVEKEIPFSDDRSVVAGILWKRLKVDMPLQVDASICYAKFRSAKGCYPLLRSDFSIPSRYNTYKFYGLPPTSIANPGLDAIRAVLNPTSSDYWYYLSDLQTKKTIFAKTLDEHNENREKYLKLR